MFVSKKLIIIYSISLFSICDSMESLKKLTHAADHKSLQERLNADTFTINQNHSGYFFYHLPLNFDKKIFKKIKKKIDSSQYKIGLKTEVEIIKAEKLNKKLKENLYEPEDTLALITVQAIPGSSLPSKKIVMLLCSSRSLNSATLEIQTKRRIEQLKEDIIKEDLDLIANKFEPLVREQLFTFAQSLKGQFYLKVAPKIYYPFCIFVQKDISNDIKNLISYFFHKDEIEKVVQIRNIEEKKLHTEVKKIAEEIPLITLLEVIMGRVQSESKTFLTPESSELKNAKKEYCQLFQTEVNKKWHKHEQV